MRLEPGASRFEGECAIDFPVMSNDLRRKLVTTNTHLSSQIF